MNICKNRHFLIIVFTLLVLGFTLVRPVNIDEGYYIASAQEVLEGKILYKDFIFHQMPLVIYFYSLISDYGYWSLPLGRALSVLLLSLSFIMLVSLVKKLAGENVFFIFLIFYFLNSFLIDWSVLIRIYSFSILLFSLGVFYIYRFVEFQNNLTYLFISVFAYSLLVFTKVTFIATYIVLLIFILFEIIRKNNKDIYKKLLVIFLASVIPAILFLLIFGKYLDDFYSNVFQVNFITKKYVDPPFISGLLKYLGFFFLPQNLVLIVVILISGFKFTIFEKFLIVNILCYTLIHIPTRMLMEHLTSISPLLVLLSCLRVQKFAGKIAEKYKFFSAKRVYIYLVVLYVLSVPFSLVHLKNIIVGTELLMNPVQLYSFEQKINLLKGTTILSSWEGYSLFSEKLPIFKEQYGGAFINKYVSEKEILKYNIAQQKEYENMILTKTPDIIIYDSLNSAHLDNLEGLINKHYNRAFRYNFVSVFTK